MCGEQPIPYDAEQIASKLRPIVGATRRVFVKAVATGTVFEVVGIETRQSRPRWKDGPVCDEDVYLLVRRVPAPISDEAGDDVPEEDSEDA